MILGFRCLVSLRFGVYVFPNMTGRRSRLARTLSFERACYSYVRYDCLMFENEVGKSFSRSLWQLGGVVTHCPGRPGSMPMLRSL